MGLNEQASASAGDKSDRISSNNTPADFKGFITQKHKIKHIKKDENISLTVLNHDGISVSSLSDEIIRRRNLLNSAAAAVERKAKRFAFFQMSYNFNFVSWNCRGGLSFARKCRFIRSLVSNQNLSLLGLIGTKRDSFNDFSIRMLWPNLDFDFCFVPSIGASGGLLCIWNPKLICPSRIFTANRWISMDFSWSNINIRFILLYASNNLRERASLWNDILPEVGTNSLCITSGDFNDILHPSERHNCSGFTSSMVEFSEFISSPNLVEVNLQGRFFTWHNSIARSKIDRCFVSPTFFTLWPHITLKALPISFSDLVPLLFNSDSVLDWEAQADIGALDEGEGNRLSGLYSEFNQLSKNLEFLWHQKSKLNWNLHGDRNSKYFHTVASIHSKSNLISDIHIDGVCFHNPVDIKRQVHLYYKDLFRKNSDVRFSLDSLPIRSLSDQ
ncbi:uncharacterized protein LOC126672692 [Mercurialis annua]|uniref:uncharacterized protein LOC126672692 n=1 Tax=Mercurialis annua TaxID=3986 RepID=UPI00215FEC7A|nr:uncharacterized protein LOC126672692 [Mercurialis annua]